MNYITIEARTYEEAVKKAHKQYGERLRIHSRRDKQARGFLGLGVSRSCEIICFLADDGSEEADKTDRQDSNEKKELMTFEQEARTPDPRKADRPAAAVMESEPDPAVSEALVRHVVRILEKNDFSPKYIEWMTGEINKQLEKALPAVPTEKEIEMTLFDRIIGSVEIDYKDQTGLPHAVVLLGPEGCGKTTTMAKMAALFGDRSTVMVSLSRNPNAADQLSRLGTALEKPFRHCAGEEDFRNVMEEFASTDVILVDTGGASPKDGEPDQHLMSLFSATGRGKFSFVLVVPATMKYSDIDAMVSLNGLYQLRAVILTMADQSGTIGNVISICRDRMLPLLYVTDGKRIPRDIRRASASFVAENLKGFSIDISKLLRE